MSRQVLVSVLMPSYNHEKYISTAIESALSQKTDFDFEILIHDDLSTDGTLKIAESYAHQYPDKIRLFTEKHNQGLLKSYKKLIDSSRGKYLAVLESDDFWTNENKLQKQIDFLEANPDYGLCAGDKINVDENGKEISLGKKFNLHIRGKTRWYEELLGNSGVSGACTVMFRKNDFEKYCGIDEWIKNGFKTFDHPTWLSISSQTQCKYIEETFAAYRVLATSISNNKDFKKVMDFNLSNEKIEEYVIKKFGLGSLSEKSYNQKICTNLMGKALRLHQPSVFVEYARKLVPQSLKQKIIRAFPRLYYFQFTVRHKK